MSASSIKMSAKSQDGGEIEQSIRSTEDDPRASEREKRLRRKIDLRLCTIGALLASMNLIDSGVISSASVTSMLPDLGLDRGNRLSVAILILTVSSVLFQLPATIIVRLLGPRIFFTCTTICFGVFTLGTAFVHTWKQMIVMRILLGIFMSGILPGTALLVSSWYKREEQQLRFAFLQVGQVIVLASGSIVNFGLNHLDGRGGLKGWQWMFLVQGLVTCVIGIVTYLWIVDFPENAYRSFCFMSKAETELAVSRIQHDRGDVIPEPFSWSVLLENFLDIKIYGFAACLFLLNMISVGLAYFLPIILQGGMGYSENKSILLAAPPYYYAAIPVVITSYVADKYRLRGPIIFFNCLCIIIGLAMMGFAKQVTVRYIGVYLLTGGYVSNWAALNSYQANNIAGQWKRVVTAAVTTACNGLGGVAGSYTVRRQEAPRYFTTVWINIGGQIITIGIVLIFTVYFFLANRKQRRSGKLIERTAGFRYNY